MDTQYLQVLLFVAHKEQDGDPAPVEEGPAGAPPPLHRNKIILYALLPRIPRYDALTKLFGRNGIIVLTTDKISAFLTEAARSKRVELVRIVVRIGDQLVDSAGRLIVSTDPFNSSLLPVLIARHATDETVGWSDGQFPQKMSHYHQVLNDETNLQIFKKLVTAGPDINHRIKEGGTLLHWAVRARDERTVALLVQCGATVDAKTRDGKTPLRLAIDVADVSDAIITSLLEGGADVNAADEQGTTPFLEALRTLRLSRMDVIVKLLDKGGDVNAEAQFGSALKLAAEAGPHCLAEILRHGPDVTRNHLSFREIFQRAASGNLPASVVRMLHRFGFKLKPADAKNIDLCNAALKLDRDIFEELLRWGAGAVVQGESGDTMSHLLLRAMMRGDSDTVEYLLKIDDFRNNLSFCDFLTSAIILLKVGCIKTILQIGDLSLSCIFNSQVLKNLEPTEGRRHWIELKHQIRVFIAHYITKVTAADLRVNEGFFASGQHFRKDELPGWVLESVPPAFLADSIVEVASLKAEKVGDTAHTYYDVLNATVPELVGLLRNPTIRYTLRSRRDFDVAFPKYWPLIDFRFRKAEYRRTLIDQGVKMFGFLQHCSKVPNEIRDRILTLLCNHELFMFIDVCTLAAGKQSSSS